MKTKLSNVKNTIGKSIEKTKRSRTVMVVSVIVGLINFMRKRSVIGALSTTAWAFLYQMVLQMVSDIIIESIQQDLVTEFED